MREPGEKNQTTKKHDEHKEMRVPSCSLCLFLSLGTKTMLGAMGGPPNGSLKHRHDPARRPTHALVWQRRSNLSTICTFPKNAPFALRANIPLTHTPPTVWDGKPPARARSRAQSAHRGASAATRVCRVKQGLCATPRLLHSPPCRAQDARKRASSPQVHGPARDGVGWPIQAWARGVPIARAGKCHRHGVPRPKPNRHHERRLAAVSHLSVRILY